MSPSDRVAQLYTLALDSFFVTFYNLQGYGGGILTCHIQGRGISQQETSMKQLASRVIKTTAVKTSNPT
jgi:hypothetical protein